MIVAGEAFVKAPGPGLAPSCFLLDLLITAWEFGGEIASTDGCLRLLDWGGCQACALYMLIIYLISARTFLV